MNTRDETPRTAAESATLPDFEPFIDQDFLFWDQSPEGGVAGVLTSAKSLPPLNLGANEGTIQPFLLEYRFPPGFGVSQGVFHVKSPSGKQLPPMFLVARGADDNGWYMDATFN